jgi:hypothetical protein
MSAWIKFVLRLALRHTDVASGCFGAASAVSQAIAADPTLAEYLAEATGVSVDQIPRLLADLHVIPR